MKVLLVQADGKLPNLALMKLSAHHKALGDQIGFNVSEPELVYVSVILKRNKANMDGLRMLYPDAEVRYGGPGYDLRTKLPDEIEYLRPDYSLYPDMDYSMGFSTRGCIRHCHFCIVPEKEGELTRWQHPKEFHNPAFKKVMLLDNNWLADKDWFMETSQWLIDRGISLSEHGMDIRLLDSEIAQRLKEMRFYSPMHFAYDSDKDEQAVLDGIALLKKAGINVRNGVEFYVYVDSPKQLESGINRCRQLKAWGTNPFVMYNIDRPVTPEIRRLMRWANRKWLFWSMDYNDYRGA